MCQAELINGCDILLNILIQQSEWRHVDEGDISVV